MSTAETRDRPALVHAGTRPWWRRRWIWVLRDHDAVRWGWHYTRRRAAGEAMWQLQSWRYRAVVGTVTRLIVVAVGTVPLAAFTDHPYWPAAAIVLAWTYVIDVAAAGWRRLARIRGRRPLDRIGGRQ